MKLLCHRGYWSSNADKNSLSALERAIANGFGIETDIRDCNGQLVISHDPPGAGDVLSLEDFLKVYASYGKETLLALNIKSDGLQQKLLETLNHFKIINYFVFDMSLPDTLGYLNHEMPTAVRISEYEDGKGLLGACDTVWLDAFNEDWYERDFLISLIESGKRVCVVSPELHKRQHSFLWEMLRSIPESKTHNLFLCTDLFDKSREALKIVND